MAHFKQFIARLNAGQFTLLAFVAFAFIFAIGIYVGKTGVLISQFVMG